MDIQLLSKVKNVINDFNKLSDDYKNKHNELITVFNYFKEIITFLYSIIERDREISQEISEALNYGNLNNNNYDHLLNTQKQIMTEFNSIRSSLDNILKPYDNKSNYTEYSHTDSSNTDSLSVNNSIDSSNKTTIQTIIPNIKSPSQNLSSDYDPSQNNDKISSALISRVQTIFSDFYNDHVTHNDLTNMSESNNKNTSESDNKNTSESDNKKSSESDNKNTSEPDNKNSSESDNKNTSESDNKNTSDSDNKNTSDSDNKNSSESLSDSNNDSNNDIKNKSLSDSDNKNKSTSLSDSNNDSNNDIKNKSLSDSDNCNYNFTQSKYNFPPLIKGKKKLTKKKKN